MEKKMEVEKRSECIIFNSEIRNEKHGQVVLIMRVEEMPVDEEMLCRLKGVMDEFYEKVAQCISKGEVKEGR